MLGQLVRRRCQRVTQGFPLREFATAEKQGRRQQPTSPPPPAPPEKTEWWAVDGELFKAEKFDPKRVLAPLENEHISNKKRRRELIKQLSRTRLKLRVHNQDSYWAQYIKRFQILRDEWEKHVWDPTPVPPPKRRHPAWLAEETQKYVWQDPRREAYASSIAKRNLVNDPQKGPYTFDVSRLDQTAIKSRFDEKIGYKGQGMGHSPYENRRNPGASNLRSGMAPLRQRNMNIGHRNLKQSKIEDFDEVFKNDTDKDRRSHADAKASLSTDSEGDSEAGMFNWSETDSEEGGEHEVKARGNDNDKDDTSSDDDEFEMKDTEQRRKGWIVHEDDLFKDD